MRGAATFGWLCVETSPRNARNIKLPAATFGWLCVETFKGMTRPAMMFGAATFGWLCVETKCKDYAKMRCVKAATFGWLCVETMRSGDVIILAGCSHLRVAVC